MQVRIRYAPELLPALPASGLTGFFRDHLHAAARTAKRSPLPSAGLVSASINLGARDLSTLAGLRDADEPWSDALSELLHGHLRAQAAVAPTAPPAQDTATHAWMRPEQRRFYEQVTAGLNDGAIVVGEAATGTGKGRAVAQAVADAFTAGRTTVVVTAPTLGVLATLAAEFRACPGTATRPMQFFLGAGQFFHAGRARQLCALIAATPDTAAQAAAQRLQSWLDAGAPAGHTASTEAFAAAASHRMSHLTDDLAFLLPEGYSAEDVTLSADEIEAPEEGDPDPGVAVALQARNLEDAAQIVFCTHAMYALHARLLGSERFLLPAHEVLVIDEAHQFEENAESVLSPSASLDQLPRLLRGLPAPVQKQGQEDIDTIQSAIAALHARYPEHGGDTVLFPEDDGYLPLQTDAARMSEALERLIDRAERARVHRTSGELLALLRRTRAVLRSAATGRSLLQVSSSPLRGYLSLTSSAQGLRRIFERLWTLVDAAILMSATLYTPTRDSRRAVTSDAAGWYSARHLTQVLALPTGRVRYLAPVRPDWVRANVTAHLTRDPARRPPATQSLQEHEYTHALNGWLDDMAGELLGIAEQARLGTLVLLTAYRDIDGLAQRLAPRLGPRLIEYAPASRLSAQREAFVNAAVAGERPIWLATGAAWTGINLTAAGESQVSDLVIARLPVGLHRSIAQAVHSRGRARFEAKATETYWQTAQGIGRMVRSPKDKDRHLWVLDARALHEPLYTPIRLLLEAYAQAAC